VAQQASGGALQSDGVEPPGAHETFARFSTVTIPWQRYWAPRDGKISLDHGGYLSDPNGKYGRVFNPELVSLAEVDAAPCLVLLGEPGIGKSTTVAQHYTERQTHSTATGLFYDLRSYGSEERLVRTIFEGPVFTAWKAGSDYLELYLDSIDECSVRIANLAALLIEQLEAVPHSRLRLRVTCRTAEWPLLLETQLKAWFPEMRVLELAPLRRADVELAAATSSIPAEPFLEQVYKAGAEAFAIKPVTLEFLLKIYQDRDGSLPSSQFEIYERGCSIHCEEKNLSRIAARQVGAMTGAERMEVASWLAAATLFSGKSVIRTAPTTSPAEADELDISALATSGENVTEQAIRETLSASGLFTARGPAHLGWAHKTYGEFLAARYVVRRKIPLPQIQDLVLHHHYRGSVVPQLREVCAWIAGERSDVFRDIAGRDPQVLLASDVANGSATERAQLVERLLGAFEREDALDDDWDERRHYRKLVHASLSEQLRPFIRDTSKNVVVRRVAIDIAEAAELHDLDVDLVSVALDSGDKKHVRQQAAHAICRIGSPAIKARLKPLLAADATEDPQDELRGLALRALHPEVLTTADIFAYVTRQRDPHMHGSYSSFLYAFAAKLTVDDLPEALQWHVATPAGRDDHGPLGVLRDTILKTAWQHSEEASLGQRLVDIVETRVRAYENPFGRRDPDEEWSPPPDDRRRIAIALLGRLPSKDASFLLHGGGPILKQDDLAWLLDRFEEESDSVRASGIAKLVASMAWREDDVDLLSRTIGLALEHSLLRVEMAAMLGPVMLDSPEAKELKQQAKSASDARARRVKPTEADFAERVEAALSKCETENIEWWWNVTVALSLGPKSPQGSNDFDFRIVTFPGWVTASHDLVTRILTLAQRYVLEGDPANDAWLETKQFRYSALAGYRALQLVLETAPGGLAGLPTATLEKWVPVIACYPSERSKELTALAASLCPDDFMRIVTVRLDSQTEEERVDAHEVLDDCWSPAIASATLAKAKTTSSASIQNALVVQGIEHADPRFMELGARLIATPLAADAPEQERKRRIELWEFLLRHALGPQWDAIWPLIRSDDGLARNAWLNVASRLHREVADLLNPLTPQQICDLYIWLSTQFPPETGRKRTGWISPTKSLEDFRDAVLGHLKNRGTGDCLAAMDRIVEAFPSNPYLKLYRVQARRAVAQGTWTPVSLNTLSNLARDPRNRVVETEEQLLSVTIESLQRLEASLSGELSPIRDFWDKTPKGSWRPVEEADVSNLLTRHLRSELQAQGIVVNREVKLRRGFTGVEGQQTDIYVDALVPGGGQRRDKVSVVVEVKGCWNKEVRTAMKGQLADRYLQDNACRHGLYVVGWFVDDVWDKDDPRAKEAARVLPSSLAAARTEMDALASDLSRHGNLIKAFLLDARLKRS
jgi:hypothetical protein